jgi:hypothetical protein
MKAPGADTSDLLSDQGVKRMHLSWDASIPVPSPLKKVVTTVQSPKNKMKIDIY